MKYYCLALPKSLTNREAVEEIFREQQAYDKKFPNLINRSGYVFSQEMTKFLPENVISYFKNSWVYKVAKYKYFASNEKSESLEDFVFIISNNEQFLSWMTLKLVEIEKMVVGKNSNIIKNTAYSNYKGMMCEFEIN